MAYLTDFGAGLLIILTGSIGIVGNGLIMLVITWRKLYESPIYLFLVSLAASDILCNFTEVFQDGPSMVRQQVLIPGMWNRALGWLLVHCFQLHVTQAIFVINVQAVSLYKKEWGEKFLTRRNVTISVIVLYLFPLWQTTFMLPFPPFSEMSGMEFVAETRTWFVNFTYPASNPIHQASGAYLIFCFIVGCLASFLILFKIWQQRNKLFDVTSAATPAAYETKRLSVQFVLIIFLWIFQSCLFYTLPVYAMDNPDVMFILSLSNPVLFGSNFFIYFIGNPTFRKAVHNTFKPQSVSLSSA